MRRRIRLFVLCLLLIAHCAVSDVQAAGVGVTAPGHEAAEAATDKEFFPRKPGDLNTRARRDLEFQLSKTYSVNRGDATPGFTSNDLTTLAKFGSTVGGVARAVEAGARLVEARLSIARANCGVAHRQSPELPAFEGDSL